MRMFGRKRKALKEELPEKVARRAKMIPTPDLLDWAEHSLYQAHRSLSAFRSRPENPEAPLHFAEAKQSLAALLAVLNEVESRTGIDTRLANNPVPAPSAILRQPE